ncbi:MAG: type I methionyl aminopeptidase [Acidimicrobiia bacterium]
MTLRKSAAQIRTMRRAGRVVAEMHEVCAAAARPGATTAAIDRAARDVLARRGARSNFLGYHGFPAVICTSPNDVVVHGIPGDLVLEAGDIISLDCGAIVDGWHADAAITVGVDSIDAEAQRLIDTTRASLDAAIDALRTGRTLADIGGAVETTAKAAGYSIVREYVGHGIGTAMHEAPEIPNYRTAKGRRTKLAPGMVLAIEPMLTIGSAETAVLEDDWTVVTADGSLAAHVEHTVAITDDGPEILTLP